MIHVVYYRDHSRVTIEGHAQSGEPGKDLVCAGASALAYTLAANVRQLEAVGQVREARTVLEPGKAEIGCKPKGKFVSLVGCILSAVCVGFEMLAQQYPQYISYEIRM